MPWDKWGKWGHWDTWSGAASLDELTYLLRAVFADHADDAAPITSPLTCVPGPGTLTAVDTGNHWSISGGKLVSDGGEADTTSMWMYDTARTRSAGLAMFVGGLLVVESDQYGPYIGWADGSHDAVDNFEAMWYIDSKGSNLLQVRYAIGNRIDIEDPYTLATEHLTSILRSVGAFFVRAGKLAWVSEELSSASLESSIMNHTDGWSCSELAVLDLPDNGYTDWDEDFSTVTDTKTNPATGTAFDCAADCHVTGTFTCENTKYVYVYIRYTDANNWVRMSIGTDRVVKLEKNVATSVTTVATGSTLTDAQGYTYDIIAEGTTVTVYIDRASDATGTISDHSTVAQGRAEHDLATNDLTVESHPFPSLGIADNRNICPAAADTFTHSADFVAEFYVDALPSAGNVDVQVRISGADEWTVRIDSTGDLDLLENATSRISAGGGTLSGGERIILVADDDDYALYYDTTQVGTYADGSGLNKTATSGKVNDLGTAGVISRLACYPRDVSDKLPEDWSP